MIRSCRLSSIGLAALAVGLVTVAFVPVTQTKPASKPGAAAPAAARAPANADDSSGSYSIDAVHSSTIFRIKHNNVSWFYGRFNEVAGQFTLDGAHPENSAVEITIGTGSVDTNNSKRDQHVMSPDFLNATEFPELTFTSEKVAKGKAGGLEVTGQLTLHGVTKPLTVQVEQTGAGPGMRPDAPPVAGLQTTFTIKRSDFGMSEMLNLLSDEVLVTVSIEGAKDH